MRLFLAVVMAIIAGCGGGGSSSPEGPKDPLVCHDDHPPVNIPVDEEPPPVDDPEPTPVVDVQMTKPISGLTIASATGDPLRPFVMSDGTPLTHGVTYPYDPESTEIALIDILVVVDTKLVERDGLTVEDFVQREFDFANTVFANSDVYIKLRVAAIRYVDAPAGDLRSQYRWFTRGLKQYNEVITQQDYYKADYAMLFKAREENAIACGVAVIDAVRPTVQQRRGIIQCYQGTVFNTTETSRYYERAHETFTHEIGHLLGAEHNSVAATSLPVFQFSYGLLLPSEYGTVMSYSNKGTELFSDPDKYFVIPETGQSVPMGMASRADVVRHLNIVRYYMSQLYEGNTEPVLDTPVLVPVDPVEPISPSPGPAYPYNIPAYVMDDTMVYTTMVVIPQGEIVSSSFETTSLPMDSGVFTFEILPSQPTPSTNVWVSLEAGGEPLEGRCFVGNNVILYTLTYSQTEWNDCVLETDTVYYLNLQHVDPEHPASSVRREVKATAYANEPGDIPEWNGDNYDIPVSVIESSSRTDELLTTPSKQGVVSSRLEMGSNAEAYGEFVWHPVPGDKLNPRLDVWISTTPNGPAIDDVYGAFYRGVLLEKIKWSSTPMNSRVYLEPYGVYYINMKSSEYREEATRVDRWVRTLTPTTTDEDDIPQSAMNSTETHSTILTIPSGGINAQAFTMPTTPQYGKFTFHYVPTLVAPVHNIWVSDTPAGEAVSDACYAPLGVKVTELRYASPLSVGLDWNCGLTPGQSYYLNIAHDDPTLPASSIERLVQVTAIINSEGEYSP